MHSEVYPGCILDVRGSGIYIPDHNIYSWTYILVYLARLSEYTCEYIIKYSINI
jgi:hypothetical protein